MKSVLFVVTEDWALYSHRFHLIQDAIKKGFKVSLATNCSVYCEMFQKAGVSVYHLPLKRKSLNPFSAIIVVIRLLLIIVKVKPDLVHAVAIKPVVFAGLALKLCSKTAAVFALGGVGYIFSSKNWKANLLRFPTTMFLKFAMSASRTALILQNKDDIALFSKFRLVDERQIFLVQGAGVETEVFKPSPFPKVVTVISPARLLKDKGIFEFLGLATAVKKSYPMVNFVLVGKIDRQNPNSIKSNLLNSWVSSGVVEHWGDIPYEKMPDVYRKATIVCLLSYREGMPKALLEGASSGRPIIAFDVVGCREIVKDGVNGRLIQFQDTQSLEDALLDLISCPKKCQRFGNMGRYHVVNQFSSKIINEKVFEVWEDLLGDIKGG